MAGPRRNNNNSGNRGNGGGNNNNNNRNNNNRSNNNNNSNGGKKSCNNCGMSGHLAADCYKPKKNQNNSNNNKKGNQKTCEHCGKSNHTSDKCFQNPSRNNKNNNNNNGTDKTRCSICQGIHLGRDCNAESGFDRDGKRLECNSCGWPHFNNACPTKHGMSKPSGTPRSHNGGFNSDGQNWLAASTVHRPCQYCGLGHLSQDCPSQALLQPGQHASQPPTISVTAVWDRNTGGWSYPPIPPPEPLQQFPSPHAIPPKYQDDSDLMTDSNPAYYTLSTQHYTYPVPSQYRAIPGLPAIGDTHTHIHRELDGDVMMMDVEYCQDCGFTVQQQIDANAEREMQRRIEEVKYRDYLLEQQRLGNLSGFGAGWRAPGW